MHAADTLPGNGPRGRRVAAVGRCLLGLLLACVPALALASTPPAPAPPVSTLARFGDGPSSLPHQLQVPDDLPNGNYLVRCEMVVRASGSTDNVACYPPPSGAPPRLVRAVAVAANAATYEPATVDGEAVPVFVLAMVMVRVTDGRAHVLAVQNHGQDAVRYGIDYMAPQRLDRFRWGPPDGNAPPAMMWMRFEIAADGAVTDSSVTPGRGTRQKDVEQVRRAMREMQFLPGRHRGEPVPMTYVEPAHRK
jgi:hypothetical protein